MKLLNNNLFRLSLVLLVITSAGSTLTAQTRNVSWLHGLGQNGTAWDEMEVIFRDEKLMITDASDISIGYESEEGVQVAQDDAVIISDPNGIVIGHSMGGVVARAIDDDPTDQRDFGGIITVGTPNNGAAIANSLLNGDVANATNFACNSMLAGPTSEIPIVPINLQGFTVGMICNGVNNFIVPLIEGQTNQSAQDLAVGSDVITNLSGQISGIPQVAIWGNERSPVHWRLLSSLASENENDTEWMDRARNFRTLYNVYSIAHTSVAVVTGIIGFFNAAAWKTTIVETYKAVQWRKGVKWLDNSEGYWNELIDCASTRTETVTFYQSGEVNCLDFGFTGSPQWIACVQQYCDPYPYCTQEPINYSVEIVLNGASDGFICKDSQIGTVATEDIYEADQANHSEEVIHINVEREIRRILDDPSSFFYTQ